MFESILNFFKNLRKTESKEPKSKNTAKERLHLVLMQDRANVSADFLEMMKQEIIEVIKKYIEVDEKEIDVRLTNGVKEDGTTEAPALYANIPIRNIRNEMKKEVLTEENNDKTNNTSEESNQDKKTEQENKEETDVEESKEGPDLEDNEEETNKEESKEETDNVGVDALGDPNPTEEQPNVELNNDNENVEEDAPGDPNPTEKQTNLEESND